MGLDSPYAEERNEARFAAILRGIIAGRAAARRTEMRQEILDAMFDFNLKIRETLR
jgi:hypothetical protein